MERDLESSWEATWSTERRNHFKGNRSFRIKYNTFRQQKHPRHAKSKGFVKSPVISIELSTKHFSTPVNLILKVSPTVTPKSCQGWKQIRFPLSHLSSPETISQDTCMFSLKISKEENRLLVSGAVFMPLSPPSPSPSCAKDAYIFFSMKRTATCMRQTWGKRK